MILKGSQRGGGKQLAAHLLKTKENEHVEVHELRGFSSDDLDSALHEVYAVSRGTRAKQFLFSLSLNPPAQEHVPVEAFEAAIEAVEQKMGLQGQPRAIVFHEKDGRRHAHVVWSRIDTGKMKAINLPHYKLKLRDVSRQLYLEHGWQMPRGLVNSKERDPRNYTREEWEQAKRAKQDPKMLKSLFQECWASSDSPKAFAQALEARGYTFSCARHALPMRATWNSSIAILPTICVWVRTSASSYANNSERLPLCETIRRKIVGGIVTRIRVNYHI